ncbi:hypothetical protein [Psychrobacter sp.]|uniref:hypothetical protein n=1 Tax=Psychrobacter sp. TaxID=56811 RepID=UPI003F978015
MNIHDLSEYQLYKLKSIDPTLSSDWQESLQEILPKLHKKSQYSVYKNILKPHGITINADKKLEYKRPETLSLAINSIQTNNKDLLTITTHMRDIVDPKVKTHDAIVLADQIEALLSYLDNLDFQGYVQDQKNRQRIRVAFLYELATWIDTVDLTIHSGLRQLNSDIVKSYFKEVYLKHQIQGREFRSWDSSDVNFQQLDHFPQFIKNEALDRKFFIVEVQHYWFLIGIADQNDQDPYSFRRFLHEDTSGDQQQFVYLTHVILEKKYMQDTAYLSQVTFCISRLYTLDRTISDNTLKFVSDIKSLFNNYLKPLLKKPLKQGGSQPEVVIKERLIKYEKQLTILILQKLPAMIRLIENDVNDRDYLFYHVDQLAKQMLDNVQDFRLQPLVMYSEDSEVMVVKLITLRRLLDELRLVLESVKQQIESYSDDLKIPLLTVKEKLTETEQTLEDLQCDKDYILNYEATREHGGFWQKLKQGKAPEYSLEDIAESQQAMQEELFMFIVRMAKNKHKGIIYPEFEYNEVINDKYRHYALADGEMGISRLPRVLRLSEDKSRFNIGALKDTLYQDIFESNQEWSLGG